MKIKGIRVAFSTGSLFGDDDDTQNGKYKYEIIEDLFKSGSPLSLIRQFEGHENFRFAITVPLINRRNISLTGTDSIRTTLREFINSSSMPREHRMSTSIFGQATLASNYSHIVRSFPSNLSGIVVLEVVYTPFVEKMLANSDDNDIRSSLDIILSNGAATGYVFMGTCNGNFNHDPELFTDAARKVIDNYGYLERIVDADLSPNTIRAVSNFAEEEFTTPDLNLIGQYISNNSLLKFCEALVNLEKTDPNCRFKTHLDDDVPYHFTVRFRRSESYTFSLRNFTEEEVRDMAYRTGLWTQPVVEEAVMPIPPFEPEAGVTVEEAPRADWESRVGVEAEADEPDDDDGDEDLYDEYEDDDDY